MLDSRPDASCCGRCAGTSLSDQVLRRRYYKAAVFPPPADAASARPRASLRSRPGAPTQQERLPGVAFGIAVDASPHVLAIVGPVGERTFTFAPGAKVWRGKLTEPGAIRAGDPVVVRLAAGRRDVADKVWARIGRATGTIVERHADTLLVDEGATRHRQVVQLSARAASRIQVRFPELTPGHLIDVIGARRGSELEALIPATALPPAFGPESVPRRPAPARQGGAVRGSATWHEPGEPGEPADGVAYPAIDPATGCAESAAAPDRSAAHGLPFLAVGSLVQVQNECTGNVRMLPVTTCGAVARLFADRCLACGTSPRSRIVDLTLSSFVRLGGDLERGCFNATVTVGW